MSSVLFQQSRATAQRAIGEGVQPADGGKQLFSSIQKLRACQEHGVKFWASHRTAKKGIDLLNWVQQKAMKIKRALEHTVYEKLPRYREKWVCFVQSGEKKYDGCCLQLGNGKIQRRWSWILLRGAQQKDDGQKTLATERKFWLSDRNIFFTVGWPSTTTGCPERLWLRHPWGYSGLTRRRPWATWPSFTVRSALSEGWTR